MPDIRKKQWKEKIVTDILRYNELVIGTGRRDIPLITSKSIKAMIKRNMKPSKTERQRSTWGMD